MGFDTWLEQDIRTFLDTEVSSESTPVITRLEDSAAISTAHDWKNEIEERLKQGDDAGAKQLFAQLRLKYLGTPKSHEEERAQLYKLMQECYVLIANHVLGDWRTKELLRRMESGPTNVFDTNVKSLDLSAPQERVHESLSEIPQLTTAAAAHLEPFAALKDSEDISLPAKDHDLFSFEPDLLIQTATTAIAKAKQAAAKPTVQVTPSKPVTAPVVASPSVVSSPSISSVPSQTTKPTYTSPAAEKLQTAMQLAFNDPRKAYDLLLPLVAPDVPREIREPAQRLIQALKPHLAPSHITKTGPSRELSSRERALGTARETAAAYTRTVRGVDDALALAGAFTRARKQEDSQKALARAEETIEELEKQYPAAAAPLRERFERVRNKLHGVSPRITPTVSSSLSASSTQDAILAAATAARTAALTHDRSAFSAAMRALENLAQNLPEEQRNLVTSTVTSMRLRIQSS